jgi:hypothetical protein
MTEVSRLHGLTVPPPDGYALGQAAEIMRRHGINIYLPWEASLDDLEQEQFDAFAEACRAYRAALATRRENEPSEVVENMRANEFGPAEVDTKP